MGGGQSGGQGHAKGIACRGVRRHVGGRDDGRGRGRVLDHGVRAVLARGRAADLPAPEGVPRAVA